MGQLTISMTTYPVLSLAWVISAAVVLGAAGCWGQRWLLSGRSYFLNWLLVAGIGASLVTGLLMLASSGAPTLPLLGESLSGSSAWTKLGLQLFAMTLSVFSFWMMLAGFFDRLIHRGSSDGLAAGRHLIKMALPTSILAMGLGFIVPAFFRIDETSSPVSWTIACLLWGALQLVIVFNAAAFGGALGLRQNADPNARFDQTPTKRDGTTTRDDRIFLWLFISLVITLVAGVVGFILLSLLMVTLGTQGRGMMVLLGLGEFDDPSVGMMAVRWIWVNALIVAGMGLGAMVVFRFGAVVNGSLGPSIRAMRQSEGNLSWFSRSIPYEKNFDANAWGGAFESAVTDAPDDAPDDTADEAPDDIAGEERQQTNTPSSARAAEAELETPSVRTSPAGVPAMLNVPPVQLGSTQAGERKSSKLPPITPFVGAAGRGPSPSKMPVASSVSAGSSASAVSRTTTPSSTVRASLPERNEELSWSSLAGVFPTRGHYVVLAIMAAVFVFYASLIPVEYKPLAWETAVKRFSNIKYYKLGIDRRADVLANLVVIVPVTYLLMAAMTGLGWGWLRRSMTALITAAVATAFVVAIEFTQEWFPPRTISLNDIQAGLSGAAVGIILWLAVGDYLTYIVKIAVSRRGSATALRQVLWMILAGIVVYGMFPMDFTLSLATLAEKYKQGRLVVIPLLQGNDGLGKTLLIFLRDMVLFAPVGLLAWRPWAMRKPWRWHQSMLAITALAVVFELMRIPVFTSHTSSVHVLGRIAGGWLGLAMVPYVLDAQGQLSLGSRWSEEFRRRWGTAAGIALTLISAAVLLYPFKFDAGEAMFEAKMDQFINWPFQLYYYAGEWSALNKVVQCMAIFMATGLVMRWAWNTTPRRRMQGLIATLVLVGVIGFGVELAQAASGQRVVHKMSLDQGISMGMQEQAVDVTDLTVSKGMLFSIGKVADVTDLMAYIAGAMAGWVLAGLTLPVSRREG